MSQLISVSPLLARIIRSGRGLLSATKEGTGRKVPLRIKRSVSGMPGRAGKVGKLKNNPVRKASTHESTAIQRVKDIDPSSISPVHSDGVPGLRMKDYTALFDGRETRKEYPYRWDYHVRMGLHASLPAFLIFGFSLIIDYFLLEDPDVKEILRDYRIVEKEMRDAPKQVEGIRQTVDDRIESFEMQVKALRELVTKMEEKFREREEEEDRRKQELEKKKENAANGLAISERTDISNKNSIKGKSSNASNSISSTDTSQSNSNSSRSSMDKPDEDNSQS